MQIKRITIRVPPRLHEELVKVADEEAVSLNALAVKALESYIEAWKAKRGHFPLNELSALLAPAAEAGDITEEELLAYVREIRHRIWQERYEKAVKTHARGHGDG